MNETAINWDLIPDIITKDQLYQICHISKSTALYLLRSGKIPCEYTGKKTRCYKIKKADVITYLEKRKVFPESYSAPAGWYKGNYTVKMKTEVPEQVLENMKLYYTELFAQYPDVLTATEISKVIGYGTTSINDWCRKGHLKAFKAKQYESHSESLFNRILLLKILSHYHPKIRLAYPSASRIPSLASDTRIKNIRVNIRYVRCKKWHKFGNIRCIFWHWRYMQIHKSHIRLYAAPFVQYKCKGGFYYD